MLTKLRRIVAEFASEPSLPRALQTLAVQIGETLRAEVSSVYLAVSDPQHFLFVANEGLNKAALGEVRLEKSEGLVALVAERAEPINLGDVKEHPRFHFVPEIGEEALNSFLGVPIIHNRRVIGVLVVQREEKARFDESDEAFLVTLSAQVAPIISHAEAAGDVAKLAEHTSSREFLEDTVFTGVSGSVGIGIGHSAFLEPLAKFESVPDRMEKDIDREISMFNSAVGAVREDITRTIAELTKSLPPEELALFDAYLHMLDDDALPGDVISRIHQGHWAQGALKHVIQTHTRRFDAMEDPYLRDRAADVEDLGLRVLAYLQNVHSAQVDIPDQAILIGDQVSSTTLTNLAQKNLAGLISVQGSHNSHVAILARALGVPAVMGALDFPLTQMENVRLIVDGYLGKVYANPSPEMEARYLDYLVEEEQFDEELDKLKDLPPITVDGWRMTLWVNIGLTSDISRSLDRGAEGIGLFRTEVPFMAQDRFPSEEEQRRIYREHLEAFSPRPVTMRMLDIGGDKSLPYFPIGEENPSLGWRGIRVTLDHPEIFLVQARAMLKANSGLDGDLRIMLPMISSMAEIMESKALVNRAYEEVIDEGVNVRKPMIGVMVEVPAAVYQARQFAKQVDFLAVGSNDLTQHLLAVDRNNPRVADLYSETHPAVLNALREVAKAAHEEDKYVGICGEFAGTPIGAILLMAMGYHVLSMNAMNLARVKWILRKIKLSDARRMLARVLRMETADEIQAFMAQELMESGLGRVIPRHLDI